MADTVFEKEQRRSFIYRYMVVWVVLALIVFVLLFVWIRDTRADNAAERKQFKSDSEIVESKAASQVSGSGGEDRDSSSDSDDVSAGSGSDGVLVGVSDIDLVKQVASRREVLTSMTGEVAELVTTWDSGDQYISNRQKVVSLGVPEDSQLLTVMMPVLKDKVLDGVRYNYVDTAKVNLASAPADGLPGRFHVWDEGDRTVVSTVIDTFSKGSDSHTFVVVRLTFDKDNKVVDGYMLSNANEPMMCAPIACSPEEDGALFVDVLNGGPVNE